MGATTPISIAQIGVGYWGPNLLRNLVANENCSVKRVVEIDCERRKFVSRRYPKLFVSENIADALEDSSIDAVVIATPAQSHFTLAKSALMKGKHVLIEKPMAKTIGEIEEISTLAKSHGLVAMAGHTFIYNSAVRYLKNLIDHGELGDIRYIYSQRLNLGRIRTDVDALWNFGPHDVSILQYLLNEQSPVSITKYGMDYVQEGIDDVVFLVIAYAKKIFAHVHISWLDPQKVRKMTVVGTKKMAVYDDLSRDKIILYDKGIDKKASLRKDMDFDSQVPYLYNHRSGNVFIPKINWVEPLRTEIQHFFDCIQKKSKCLTGPEHAKNVIKILSNQIHHKG